MRELSHHVLDLICNSTEAGARRVEIRIEEDCRADTLTITVTDDGHGMNAEKLSKALDPFFTTRTTRNVGLGLSLLEASARASEGDVRIESQEGKGTTVEVRFRRSHVDRPPLGDMMSTLLVAMIAAPETAFVYRHQINGRTFEFDTTDLDAQLDFLPRWHPEAVRKLMAFLEEGFRRLQEVEAAK